LPGAPRELSRQYIQPQPLIDGLSRDEDKTKEMLAICKLITWLDGYANLSCVDPLKIEKTMRLCGDDVQGILGRIKDDVYAIGRLPRESERVVRLAKIVNVSRFLFFVFAVLAIALFLLASQIAPRLFSNPSYSLLTLVIIVVVFNANVIVYVFSGRRLSLAVKEFFEGSRDRAKPERRRVKDAAQALIDKLASRIKSAGTEPGGYRFTLLDSSYAHVRVTKEGGSYTAVVNLGAR